KAATTKAIQRLAEVIASGVTDSLAGKSVLNRFPKQSASWR
ncbi:MAG: hypothetical protein ACI814_005292, partial [Mariniblastus sp.]